MPTVPDERPEVSLGRRTWLAFADSMEAAKPADRLDLICAVLTDGELRRAIRTGTYHSYDLRMQVVASLLRWRRHRGLARALDELDRAVVIR